MDLKECFNRKEQIRRDKGNGVWISRQIGWYSLRLQQKIEVVDIRNVSQDELSPCLKRQADSLTVDLTLIIKRVTPTIGLKTSIIPTSKGGVHLLHSNKLPLMHIIVFIDILKDIN